VAWIAFEQMENIYKSEFAKSEEYRELVVRLHDNLIEYNFLTHAGLLKA